MKKNRTMRLAALLLVLVLMTSCFVGGTFAKYTSTTTGTSTATVAKWSIEVNDTEIAVTGDPAVVTFNLFTTINDTGNVEDETDVADGKIAPGTAGSFDLTIENLSEVTAKWTIALSETNDSNIPLQYSVDGTTWKDSITELAMTDLTDQTIAMSTGTTTQTVYWRWVFEGTTAGAHANQTDTSDTALGIAAQTTAPTVTVTATITATQVD